MNKEVKPTIDTSYRELCFLNVATELGARKVPCPTLSLITAKGRIVTLCSSEMCTAIYYSKGGRTTEYYKSL